MEVKTKEVYSEVYSILNILGDSYIARLPSSLFNMIKEEKEDSYNPQYEATISIEKQNIKKDTLAMIALLHLNYWCDSDEEKKELKKLLQTNEEKHQLEIREKYNPDNLFKNKKEEIIEKIDEPQSNLPMEIKKQNFFVRLIDFIKNLFKH